MCILYSCVLSIKKLKSEVMLCACCVSEPSQGEEGKDVDYEAISDDDLDDLIENVADEDKDKEEKLSKLKALCHVC